MSFMAAAQRARPERHHPGHQHFLMDDDNVAQDHDEPQEVEHEEAQHDSDMSDSSSTASEAPEGYEPHWCTTMIYALNRHEIPLRLDWNGPEHFHREVARALNMQVHFLLNTHHIQNRPEDLQRANTEAVIAHKHGDLTPGSTLRLTLIDVEYHAPVPVQQPEVSRRVYKLPRYLGRLTLLHALGLGRYCRAQDDSCVVWRNHEIISKMSFALLAIPPGPEDICHIGTRCIATAYHQGMTIEELQHRHAQLCQAGLYDTVLGPPIVPVCPDFERVGGADLTLLQISFKRTWNQHLNSTNRDQ